jgi:hypothetical protein
MAMIVGQRGTFTRGRACRRLHMTDRAMTTCRLAPMRLHQHPGVGAAGPKTLRGLSIMARPRATATQRIAVVIR